MPRGFQELIRSLLHFLSTIDSLYPHAVQATENHYTNDGEYTIKQTQVRLEGGKSELEVENDTFLQIGEDS